jgi:hypothetical protein
MEAKAGTPWLQGDGKATQLGPQARDPPTPFDCLYDLIDSGEDG